MPTDQQQEKAQHGGRMKRYGLARQAGRGLIWLIGLAVVAFAVFVEVELYALYRYRYFGSADTFVDYLSLSDWHAKVLAVFAFLGLASLVPDRIWGGIATEPSGSALWVRVVSLLRAKRVVALVSLPALGFSVFTKVWVVDEFRENFQVVSCPPALASDCSHLGCTPARSATAKLCTVASARAEQFVLGEPDDEGRRTVVEVACSPGAEGIQARMRTLERPALGAKARYVAFVGPCSLQGLGRVNSRIRTEVITRLIEYAKGVNAMHDELGISKASVERYFKLECSPTLVDKRMVSGFCEESYYVGGIQAHDAHDTVSWTYDSLERDPRKVSLDEVIVDGGYAWGRLEELAKKELTLQMAPTDWPDPELAVDLGEVMRGSFAMSKDGLVFRFERYSVDAYISGAREVRIPFRDLDGVVRARWIR